MIDLVLEEVDIESSFLPHRDEKCEKDSSDVERVAKIELEEVKKYLIDSKKCLKRKIDNKLVLKNDAMTISVDSPKRIVCRLSVFDGFLHEVDDTLIIKISHDIKIKNDIARYFYIGCTKNILVIEYCQVEGSYAVIDQERKLVYVIKSTNLLVPKRMRIYVDGLLASSKLEFVTEIPDDKILKAIQENNLFEGIEF